MDERVQAVAQEAIDATATVYVGDASVDVEAELRREMSSRGVNVTSDEWLREVAHQIRSGHPLRVGPSDGSMDA